MKFSVCIPTYNRPLMIKKAIDSVLAQNISNFEIVICDNSENPDTEDIVRTYSDQRIHYFRHGRNIGIAGNWNTLLEKSKGEYVKFLNDDDELLPNCMEYIAKKLLSLESRIDQHIGVVTCAAEYVDEAGNFLKRDRPITGVGFSDFYIKAQDVPWLWCYDAVPLRTPTHMAYHRETALAMDGFDVALDYSRDVHLALRLASESGVLVLDACPLARVTLHSGQDVKGVSIETRIADLKITKEWAIKEAETRGFMVNRKAVLAEVCLRETALMIKAGRGREFRVAFGKWMRYRSFSSIFRFIDHNILRFSDFREKYIRITS